MRIPFGPQGAQKWELQAERLIPNGRTVLGLGSWFFCLTRLLALWYIVVVKGLRGFEVQVFRVAKGSRM